MKYTNCSTCGGAAKFISENFERAGILISAENEALKNENEILADKLITLEFSLKNSIKEMNSTQLRFLYHYKLREELIKEQERKDVVFKNIDRAFYETVGEIPEGLTRVDEKFWNRPFGKEDLFHKSGKGIFDLEYLAGIEKPNDDAVYPRPILQRMLENHDISRDQFETMVRKIYKRKDKKTI